MHSAPKYIDYNRERCWDTDFLDSAWLSIRNLEFEDAFRRKIKSRNQGLDDEQFRQQLEKAGKNKQVCVVEKKIRKDIWEIFATHLRWHPLTHLRSELPKADLSMDGIKDVWREQTFEMHEACKVSGQSWAWEYLWKNWYCPDRWVIWA